MNNRLRQAIALSTQLYCYRIAPPIGSCQRPFAKKSNNKLTTDEQSMIEENIEQLEDFHDLVEKRLSQPDFHRQLLRKEDVMRKQLKYQIIQRKFFKRNPEVNLLTWAAKEQIRFLHQEDPDEWTAEKLSESFPVSQEGIKKILQSKFVPKSLEEIVRHDHRVREHWKTLQKKSPDKIGGPIVDSRGPQLPTQLLLRLQYAAGNQRLPAPDSKDLVALGDRNIVAKKPANETGSFASIVYDYCVKKNAEIKHHQLNDARNVDEKFAKHLLSNSKLLRRFVNDVRQRLPGGFNSPDGRQTNQLSEHKSVDEALLNFVRDDSNLKDEGTLNEAKYDSRILYDVEFKNIGSVSNTTSGDPTSRVKLSLRRRKRNRTM